MKIVVDGLDNDMKYAKNLRRALVLHFARRGDEFYPQRESLAFKGKDFEYVWNWYQGITIQKPSKMTIETPTKKREKDMWYYKYELANRTGKPQDISLRRFDSVVTVKVNLAVNRKVSRLDAESGRTIEKAVDREFNGDVEVNLVDDGKSTIHRAQVMREIGAEFRADRFFKGTLKPGKTVEGLVVFDQTDVDFGPIYTYIESRLNAQGFESTLEDPQTIEDFFVKVRPPLIKLTEEEKNSIRDQVIAAVPDALDDLRGDKRIIADVTARAGIASGTFRIRRTYFQRGKIEEFWINKWEVY